MAAEDAKSQQLIKQAKRNPSISSDWDPQQSPQSVPHCTALHRTAPHCIARPLMSIFYILGARGWARSVIRSMHVLRNVDQPQDTQCEKSFLIFVQAVQRVDAKAVVALKVVGARCTQPLGTPDILMADIVNERWALLEVSRIALARGFV